MKKLKKYISILLCATLSLSTAVPAFAATVSPKSDHVITKYEIRQDFEVAVAITASIFPIGSKELKHSLANKPTNRNWGTSSASARAIANTKEYKQLIADIKTKLDKKTGTSANGSGSITISSDKDLLLAYHGMSYTYTATRTTPTASWSIKVIFTDIYDFDKSNWKKNTYSVQAMINAINDYGAVAQSMGAIVPFNIKVTMPAVKY